MCDKDNECCIIVLKRGKTTDLTVGLANDIFSYARNYFGYEDVSEEWAILPFDNESGPFLRKVTLAPSLSTALPGCIGGILTGGSGVADSLI